MLASLEALEAVRQEATGLQDMGVWDGSTVREKAEVAAQARRSGIQVHFGQLMTIASIKFFELARHVQKVEGRIVFRGDCAKDEPGAPAGAPRAGGKPHFGTRLKCLYPRTYGEISDVDRASARVATEIRALYYNMATRTQGGCGRPT